MKVLITGLPGSGKTTQAEKVSKGFNLCLVKTGDLLRKISLSNSDIAAQIKQKLEKGDYVDNQLVGSLVKDRIEHPDCQDGIVVDGYPRMIDQLNYFDPKFDKVFYLHISPQAAEKRLALRGRHDDKPEIIKHRLAINQQQIQPLLDHFKNTSEFIQINGSLDPGQVYQQIAERLKDES